MGDFLKINDLSIDATTPTPDTLTDEVTQSASTIMLLLLYSVLLYLLLTVYLLSAEFFGRYDAICRAALAGSTTNALSV